MNTQKKDSSFLKMIHRIPVITVIVIILFVILLSMVGCAEPAPIKATWVSIPLAFDNMSVPLNEVTENKIVHFSVETESTGKMAFMAYELDKQIYVRSNVCPPCMSVGFSLQKNTLVCDTCSTTFNAKTGEGIKGACVDFPKESVDYNIVDKNITMNIVDMAASYRNTIEPGW